MFMLCYMARCLTMTGTPLSFDYDLIFEKKCITQGNDLGHRNNVKDWVIRG